ncbi:UNVERIFIED_CONTAM: hypothetical protein Slati_2693100 [Sesamum latifolium]|uniref:Uncharacterized protein n=1 Tax=Sesamum latifolium TaxID=2727402 RepID=A0AAW2VWC3_9LAMI
MRSDLQDPFQKEFLQVKLSLLKYSNFHLQPSAGELATWRARTMRARDLRASELASLHLASSLAGNPASSRVAELATCELGALVHPMDFLLLALKQSNCLRN